MRACGFCKWLKNGSCEKGYPIEPFAKIDGYKRPKYCTKKQESVKKVKESKDSWLNKQLDKLWSKAVRESVGRCELCGKQPPEVVLHAHHIFSRRNFSTRWDVNNGICLCTGCHLYKAHKDIQEFSDWVVEHCGKEHIDRIRLKAHSIADYSKDEKKGMIKDFKKMLDSLQK